MAGNCHDEQDSILKAIKRILSPAHAIRLACRAYCCMKNRGLQALWRAVMYRIYLMLGKEDWRFHVDVPLRSELKKQQKHQFSQAPRISIVVPMYDTQDRFFRQLMKSVQAQSYSEWELVLADASQPQCKASLIAQKWAQNDSRVRYLKLKQNGGISENTNAGLKAASGEYLALLDHDDVLSANALFEVVTAINEHGADLLYSDEVVLDERLCRLKGYHFKPDYAPDTLRGCNYMTHFLVFHRALLQQAGFERAEFDGAQDFDFVLRLSEHAKQIVHIPKVLYYWRGHRQSTAANIQAKPQAIEAGRCAVQEHLIRVGLCGSVLPLEGCPGAYRILYEIRGNPLVSILIPNKDHAEDLERCILSIFKYAGWQRLEIIIVENNSQQEQTLACYRRLTQQFSQLRVIEYQGSFNYSAINNFAVKHASGEYLLLLNNDVELLTPNFVQELLSYAQRDDVGAVGAKLLYPDRTVQHAGIFLGLGGSAGHNHKGHPADSAGAMYRLATVQNMNAVTGACLMVKASLYTLLGGLDEEAFAVAYNDVDFCLRLRQQGLLNVMSPFAVGVHYESKTRGDDTQSGGAKQRRYEAERARFIQRYADWLARGDEYYNRHLTLRYENYGCR